MIYLRYDGTIEDREHGQKKIAGNRPAFSKMQNQVEYDSRSGELYSLLMGGV